jgi:hypothetical protein
MHGTRTEKIRGAMHEEVAREREVLAVKHSFDLDDTIIAVMVGISGSTGEGEYRFALDTGATQTTISLSVLQTIGCNAQNKIADAEVVTGSGVGEYPIHLLAKVEALDFARNDFPVMGMAIPEKASFAGVLGKDFFRGKVLTIDFRNGTIEVS